MDERAAPARLHLMFKTRFAPSPTGYLHLGHAYSALLTHDRVKSAGGAFILRIEDTDTGRCKPEYEAAIFEDLAWLGIEWASPVMHQSRRLDQYDRVLNRLIDAGYCYPCSCSRRDIRDALSAPHKDHQPHLTPDGTLYPGTCRARPMADRQDTDAIRLNMARVLDIHPEFTDLTFTETGPENAGVYSLNKTHMIENIGDIVLARRDIRTASYHLAVVIDDAAQNITEVTRGTDLFHATYIHRLLQALLDLPTPQYHHHRLITDENGARLAKRDDARAIRTYRQDGRSPQDLRALVALS